jgi:hypothetical protein
MTPRYVRKARAGRRSATFREWVTILVPAVICVLFLALGCGSSPGTECNSGIVQDHDTCASSTYPNSVTATAVQEDCDEQSFTVAGACPSSGLLGCCVTQNNAVCYYSGYDGGVSAAETSCVAGTWQTTAP